MSTTMSVERPGCDWNDGAGETPIGTFAATVTADVIDKVGREGLKVTLDFTEALGETTPLSEINNNTFEHVFWLDGLLATRANGEPNKYVGAKRREFKQFVSATGQELPDISNFADLAPLKAFADAVNGSTINVRTYRSSNNKVYCSFDVRL